MSSKPGADDLHMDRATAPSAYCRWCGLPIAKLLGLWTDDDGTLACYEQPKFPGDHEPAPESTAGGEPGE